MIRPTGSALLLCVVVLFVGHATMASDGGAVLAGDVVTVRTADGRVRRGEVDALTDEHRLWLRSTTPNIAISGSVRWRDVLGVRHGDREFSAAEFRPLAETLKSKLPDEFFETKVAAPDRNARRDAEYQTVHSLHIEASAANWDADVEVDGLQIRVMPLAADGSVVPAAGMLSVRLIGRNLHGIRPRNAFPEIGHWSKRVRAADFDAYGAVYRFPFRTVHPEFDLDVGTEALVHARLGISGQGNLEASAAVQFRANQPLRDQLQLREQKRFFPGERTGYRHHR